MLTLPPAKYVLPNLVTLSASLCGFVSLWIASQATSAAEFYTAASLIAFAVFLDGFDGRVARMLNAQTKMGGQLDSFSDFLTFGVAPGVLIYAWGLRPLGFAGLLIAFLFAASVMVRLARFNVEAETKGGASRFFTGLPSPMGGLAVAALVGVNAGVLERDEAADAIVPSLALFVVLVALLMVSNVPFRTFKDLRPDWRTRSAVLSLMGLQVLVGIRAGFVAALAVGLLAYLGFHLTGGLLTATRAVRAGRGRGPVVADDEDDEA